MSLYQALCLVLKVLTFLLALASFIDRHHRK